MCKVCVIFEPPLFLFLSRQAFNSETDNFKLLYGGHQYHASCANFWINCVEPKPPGLILPDLLWVWSAAGAAGWRGGAGGAAGAMESWVAHTHTLQKMLKITGSSLSLFIFLRSTFRPCFGESSRHSRRASLMKNQPRCYRCPPAVLYCEH